MNLEMIPFRSLDSILSTRFDWHLCVKNFRTVHKSSWLSWAPSTVPSKVQCYMVVILQQWFGKVLQSTTHGMWWNAKLAAHKYKNLNEPRGTTKNACLEIWLSPTTSIINYMVQIWWVTSTGQPRWIVRCCLVVWLCSKLLSVKAAPVGNKDFAKALSSLLYSSCFSLCKGYSKVSRVQ